MPQPNSTRVAALDLGTNTFLCLVADVDRDGLLRVVHDDARVIRLGQGVDASKRLHPDALDRAETCLREFEGIIRASGAERVIACATSAARDAANGGELVAAGARHGIPIVVIDGNREAELTYAGTVDAGIAPGIAPEIAIVDVGGGSTELIFGGPSGLTSRLSVDVGSVRLTERFLPTHPAPPADVEAARAWVRSRLQTVHPAAGRSVIAVAGTATTLAALDLGLAFDAGLVDGHAMTVERIHRWGARLAEASVEQRRRMAGMDAGRADVILAGAICLELACAAIGAAEVRVSTRGLRYGIALKHGEFA